MNGANVFDRVFAGQHNPVDSEVLDYGGATRVMNGHLRRPVDFEARINLLDQSDEANVLDDHCIGAAVDRFAEE